MPQPGNYCAAHPLCLFVLHPRKCLRFLRDLLPSAVPPLYRTGHSVASSEAWTRFNYISKNLEAVPRVELGIKVLQTSALPLGHTALFYHNHRIFFMVITSLYNFLFSPPYRILFNGGEIGTRTRKSLRTPVQQTGWLPNYHISPLSYFSYPA